MAVIITAVDLRARFVPVRDQGQRPTCLAFAASDAHSAARNDLIPLSAEFVFFHAQRRAKRLPTQGAVLTDMLSALKNDGQPDEAGWPYSNASPDPASWKPPTDVGAVFKRNGGPHTASIDKIVAELNAGMPVLVLAMLSRSFYRPTPEGIVDRATGEQPEPARRHAVVAVGFGTVDNERAVLVRNSWGSAWGMGGYAWLTETFLAPCLTGAAKMLEEI